MTDLAARTPVNAEPLRRWLAAHALPGAERYDPATGVHTRVVPAPDGPVVVSVDLGPDARARTVRVLTAGASGGGDPSAAVLATVGRWLDLDADTDAVEDALAASPRLAPLVAARPGLRVPRTVDGAETALLTVLGQQVSLAAARTFGGRLVAAFGRPVADGLTAFPRPAVLAAAGPDALRATTGVTGARALALHTLAAALADGLDLDAAALAAAAGDPDAARRAHRDLLALRGIGPWTADYVALRVLGDSDAFLGSDLVLRRALGGIAAREATASAEPWRPWRGYALLHLWTDAVFA
ncbi:DNA-3-methyladenine glycosylase family protein [Kineococcus rubinsiae]|uniref:DNA-3-methyladenine glycosylase family protein n=1 Tax=Kineococcus rubinsiae TaxID=2609562 RepID=UPI001431FAAF|nr:DNA-3-methyladenine glycosylase 2 family protein [Kineococcus rubinsiae]NIZ90130.1 DNA-3-methyladenine glycosylase 2 family protein [Kineococcus rubinsiae]